MSKNAKAFDASRPSRAKERAARVRQDAVRFVEGERKPEAQNIYLDAELRLEIQIQATRNRESISAFAARAFRRELAESTFVKPESTE